MKLYVETCNLVFDSEDPRCRLIRSRSQGADFVFVQCLDVGIGRDFAAAREKNYWGAYDETDPAGSVKSVMERGGSWPDLQ
ncbi:TPA: hypothetical protein ACFNMI_000046 [Neisseria bacilliformis]